MRWTSENKNMLTKDQLLQNVACNEEINRKMSEQDFDTVISYMVEKEFAHQLKGGKLYILAKSM